MTSFPKLRILIGALALILGTSAHAEHYKVFLLGGQSNMHGNGSKINRLPVALQAPQEDVLFYFGGTSNHTPAILMDLQPGGGSAFGPEVSFGRAIADARPDDNYYLIKYAQGGTNLHSDWDPATGSKYNLFRTGVTYGLDALTKAGHTYEIVGMLWTQGERDAAHLRTTAQYEADLNEFIADIRTRYGANVAFYISRLSVLQTARPIAEVRAAQENVAASDPNAYLIDTDSFEMGGDKLHFTEAGLVSLGQAFGKAYLSSPPVDSTAPTIATLSPPHTPPGISGSGTSSSTTAAALIDGSRITATASNYSATNTGDPGWHPYRSIDGSGLSAGEHGTAQYTGWMTSFADPSNEWIQWDLGASYTLDAIHLWNINSQGNNGFSIKSVDIYFSNKAKPGDPEGAGAANWTKLGGAAAELPQAPASGTPNTGFDLATATSTTLPITEVRYIRFELNSNWTEASSYNGLAEIQFFAKPSGPDTTDPIRKLAR